MRPLLLLLPLLPACVAPATQEAADGLAQVAEALESGAITPGQAAEILQTMAEGLGAEAGGPDWLTILTTIAGGLLGIRVVRGPASKGILRNVPILGVGDTRA